MPSFLDSLPQGLLTSSSGQGFGAAGAAVAGAIATHFGATGDVVAAAALLGYGAVMLVFPQRLPPPAAGTPAAAAVAAASAPDFAAAVKIVTQGLQDYETAKTQLAVIAPRPIATDPEKTPAGTPSAVVG